MIEPATLREYARYPSSAYVPIHQDTLLKIAAQIEAARRTAFEEAAQICEAQVQIFLSNRFAINQPVGSMRERFGASSCARAIRAAAGLPDPYAEP